VTGTSVPQTMEAFAGEGSVKWMPGSVTFVVTPDFRSLMYVLVAYEANCRPLAVTVTWMLRILYVGVAVVFSHDTVGTTLTL
jgi:hypothetical protein